MNTSLIVKNTDSLTTHIRAMDAEELAWCEEAVKNLLCTIKAVRDGSFQPSEVGEEELELHHKVCELAENLEPLLSLINADGYFSITSSSVPAVKKEVGTEEEEKQEDWDFENLPIAEYHAKYKAKHGFP